MQAVEDLQERHVKGGRENAGMASGGVYQVERSWRIRGMMEVYSNVNDTSTGLPSQQVDGKEMGLTRNSLVSHLSLLLSWRRGTIP